jgi:hypothetical protein
VKQLKSFIKGMKANLVPKIDNVMLTLYTIYFNASDYPGKYVVRKGEIGKGAVTMSKTQFTICETIEEARACVPTGLYRFPRDQDDALQIVETYL